MWFYILWCNGGLAKRRIKNVLQTTYRIEVKDKEGGLEPLCSYPPSFYATK